MIEQHMVRTRRYEFAYLSQAQNVRFATQEHDDILDALRQGDLAAACRCLEQNMSSSSGPIEAWVTAQLSSTGERT